MVSSASEIQEKLEKVIIAQGGCLISTRCDYNRSITLEGMQCVFEKTAVECMLPYFGELFYSQALHELYRAGLAVRNISLRTNDHSITCSFDLTLKGE